MNSSRNRVLLCLAIIVLVAGFRAKSALQFNACTEDYYVPNDPLFVSQWNLSSSGIGAPNAWERYRGNPNVAVGVIEDGMRTQHEDFESGRFFGPDIGGDHGTMVAGIIGAWADNGIGAAGIDWESKIQFYSRAGSFNQFRDVVNGIDEVQITNSSFGKAWSGNETDDDDMYEAWISLYNRRWSSSSAIRLSPSQIPASGFPALGSSRRLTKMNQRSIPRVSDPGSRQGCSDCLICRGFGFAIT